MNSLSDFVQAAGLQHSAWQANVASPSWVEMLTHNVGPHIQAENGALMVWWPMATWHM